MVTNLRKERAPIELGAVALDGHTRAFLKLQEGCDQFCSYCIVPFSRGLSRSVEPRRVIDAIDGLHQRGFKEAILSGVHLGSYGNDMNPAISLASLLEMLAERAPLGRIRLSSIDPEELSDEIIAIVAGSDKFCPHFHLPMQAGADGILARMRRRYTTADYRGRVDKIIAAMPDAAIGTDVIAGFPGETEQDFAQTFNFIESLPLAYLHVFPYSVRAGTTAAKFADRVDPSVIKRRAAALRELGEIKRRRFAAAAAGHRLSVLLEQHNGGRLEGYSRNYVRVITDGPATLVNQEVEVEASFVQGVAVTGQIIRTFSSPGA